jgi:hypothetical protein
MKMNLLKKVKRALSPAKSQVKNQTNNNSDNVIGKFDPPNINIRTQLNDLIVNYGLTTNVIYETCSSPHVHIDELTLQPVHFKSIIYNSGYYVEYNKDKINNGQAAAELKHWPTFLIQPDTISSNSKSALVNILNRRIENKNAIKVVFVVNTQQTMFYESTNEWRVRAHFINKK